ncbi:TPA: tail fiber assembly protein [Escherichia coli]|nr:tail fiber assembly protein [Escherichia coli]
MLFNKLNFGFYDPNEKYFYGESWPDEMVLIEIDDKQYEIYSGQPPRGYILSADENGNPMWEEVPGQIEENNIGIIESLMAVASAKIAPLQDAIDMDIATEKEAA